MSTHYERTIRFAEVDGAGFVFFANYLVLCHEAYEASLAKAGLELRKFFGENKLLIPITKTQAQFLGPLQSGDRVRIELTATATGDNAFGISYRLVHLGATEKLVGLARTEHMAIDLHTLERKALPAPFMAWLRGAGPATTAN